MSLDSIPKEVLDTEDQNFILLIPTHTHYIYCQHGSTADITRSCHYCFHRRKKCEKINRISSWGENLIFVLLNPSHSCPRFLELACPQGEWPSWLPPALAERGPRLSAFHADQSPSSMTLHKYLAAGIPGISRCHIWACNGDAFCTGLWPVKLAFPAHLALLLVGITRRHTAYGVRLPQPRQA